LSEEKDSKTIYCKIDSLLESRGMTLTELSNLVGITYANLSVLKNNHAKAIRFSTLQLLCEALDCQIGDLFEYIPAVEEVTAQQSIIEVTPQKTGYLLKPSTQVLS
jgi:putative transcriptional regulator